MTDLFYTQIAVYSPKLEDLGIDQKNTWVDLCIQKDQIIGVRDTPQNPEGEGAVIYTKGGDSFITNESYLDVYNQIFAK